VRSEAEIVAGLRRADASAFDALYELYRARIHGFLLRLSGRRDVAEDLFQETWINAARAAPRLREDSRLGPWLYRIARNEWVSHRRWSMLDLSRLVALRDEGPYASDDAAPDDAVAAHREAARIERAIASLPPALREALLLVAVEGLEQKEAAEVLGIKYDLLRQRLTRARERLAELVRGDEPSHTAGEPERSGR
jgi:RNA polymerase sigma-70 factor (ECF subfamily)